MSRLVLGTAGHIDHGKTSLVRALTGVDTDRLREEKERGITIDLGFARLDLDDGEWAGVVDVPGHEGFIRNMVAGAAGIDAVLLVVAADEGVMPQTREHLAIIDLLGVTHGVVALTKSDLVDPEWMELVAEDVLDTLKGTSIEDAPLVPASVKAEGGLAALRAELGRVLANVEIPAGRVSDLFRMPVDRSFSVRGTGTVATGTVWSGSIRSGEQVLVRPGRERARIRGIEVHGHESERAQAGQRTAIALVGLQPDKVPRGTWLTALEGWEETSRFTSRIRMLASADRPLERGQRVRVHVGTAEVMARVYPANTPDVGVTRENQTIVPGSTGWAELRLEQPVLARARDRFVLRSYSPMTTIGGGEVAEPHPPRRKLSRTPTGLLATLLDGSDLDAERAALELAGAGGVRVHLMPVQTGLAPAAGRDEIGFEVAGRLYTHSLAQIVQAQILEMVASFHAESPLDPGMSLERLRGGTTAPNAVVDDSIRALESESRLRVLDGLASLPGFVPVLDPVAAERADTIRERYREAGLAPPRVADLDIPGLPLSLAWAIVRFLARADELVQLEDDLFVWTPHFEAAVEQVRSTLAGRSGLGPADFREALGVSRKYMLPLLHRLDHDGVTVRLDGSRSVPDGSPEPKGA